MSNGTIVSATPPGVVGIPLRGSVGTEVFAQQRPSVMDEASTKINLVRSTSAPSVQETASVTRESIEAAAIKIQGFVSAMSRNLNISVDSASGKSVIRVVDPQSNEMVRQIPGEEALRLARTIDFLSSILVSQKA